MTNYYIPLFLDGDCQSLLIDNCCCRVVAVIDVADLAFFVLFFIRIGPIHLLLFDLKQT